MKSDIANFIRKTDFDNKLKNFKKKRIKNELSKNVKEISTKELTKKIDK